MVLHLFLVASRRGHLDIVKISQLQKEPTRILLIVMAFTPLHRASQGGHYDIVEYLIAELANLNAVDTKGFTPLYIASLNGHLDVVKCPRVCRR